MGKEKKFKKSLNDLTANLILYSRSKSKSEKAFLKEQHKRIQERIRRLS